jgi:2,3-bisphosphoglycerate-independent phosphoglycerate mutase
MTPRPVMLTILDGWGWREETADNAVKQARTPTFTGLWDKCPRAFLKTSGLDVGLPAGQMGNSEVGHLNLGAGRVVMQDLPRITVAAEDGTLARAVEASGLIAALKASGGTCHLMGLISPGGVHSHQDHAVALANILADAGVLAVLHAFTDGRDTPPRAGAGYMAALEAALPQAVPVATVTGRYWAMDRDKRWERVRLACQAIVDGQGARFAAAQAAIADAYARNVTDEFLPVSIIGSYAGIRDGDALLSFNFRADRVRQLLAALIDPSFDGFARRQPRLVAAVGMTQYSEELDRFLKTLFAPQTLAGGLGETVAKAGLAQLRIAESEKYPHVTYFLNGGEETPFPGEDRVIVTSPKVATYDLQPEMSAPEVGDRAVDAIRSGHYDLIILNFANPDMVGHTGDLQAAIKAVESVDLQLDRIADAIEAAGGALLVTADHGNCELMRDPATGGPHTAHTTNPVPVLLFNTDRTALRDGRLADLAPTLLDLLGLAQPANMTGASLIS